MRKNLVNSKKSSTFAPQFSYELIISRSRAVVARQAHNLKVVGSIPSSATTEKAAYLAAFLFFITTPFSLSAHLSARHVVHPTIWHNQV